MPRATHSIAVIAATLIAAARADMDVRQGLEARGEDGAVVRAGGRSPAAEHHPLARVTQVRLEVEGGGRREVQLVSESGGVLARVPHVPLGALLPRLRYPAAHPPDGFDAMNLMLAEFSRNGVTLAPPADARPEVALVNNCLAPGLWEVSARDEVGEVFHGWFQLPPSSYAGLVARANRLPPVFVADALTWSTRPVPADMGRLRRPLRRHGAHAVELLPEVSFQPVDDEQRRKFSRGFVSVTPTRAVLPAGPEDLARLLYFRDFEPPGRYTAGWTRAFELGFLLEPGPAEVLEVAPRTRQPGAPDSASDPGPYFEVTFDLGKYRLCLGNLPLGWLRRHRSLRLHGFGVGIPPPRQDLAARRTARRGLPSPPFAYLMDGTRVLNSHDLGLETIDLELVEARRGRDLRVVLGSFERVVALAGYRVELPAALGAPGRGGGAPGRES